jgi:hypothetical protein
MDKLMSAHTRTHTHHTLQAALETSDFIESQVCVYLPCNADDLISVSPLPSCFSSSWVIAETVEYDSRISFSVHICFHIWAWALSSLLECSAERCSYFLLCS